MVQLAILDEFVASITTKMQLRIVLFNFLWYWSVANIHLVISKLLCRSDLLLPSQSHFHRGHQRWESIYSDRRLMCKCARMRSSMPFTSEYDCARTFSFYLTVRNAMDGIWQDSHFERASSFGICRRCAPLHWNLPLAEAMNSWQKFKWIHEFSLILEQSAWAKVEKFVFLETLWPHESLKCFEPNMTTIKMDRKIMQTLAIACLNGNTEQWIADIEDSFRIVAYVQDDGK